MRICQFLSVLIVLIVSEIYVHAGNQLLAYEGFTNYVAGNLPGQPFQGIGFLVGGSWIGLDSSYSVSTPNAGQFNPNGLISPVVAINGGKVTVQGNNSNLKAMLDLSSTGSFAKAGLVDSVSGTIGGGSVSGALYISFLFRAISTNRSGEYGGLQLTRGDTPTNGVLIGNSLPNWAYSLFDPVSNTSVDLINNNGTGGYYIMENNTHLFVVRIVYAPNAPDALTAWLDPIVSLGETNQNTSFTYTGTVTGDYSFDRFFLRGGSANPFDYDEIRFGTNWSSVLPQNPKFQLPASGPIVPELAPLEQVMTNVIANHGLYAGTVALMKNSLLVFRQGYGWRDTNLTQVIHPDNLCRVASVSKPITGSAINKLVSAGKISMSTPVYAFLGIPPFGGVLGDSRITSITVQELVNHSGGWTGGGSGSECVFQTIPISTAMGLNYPAAATNVISWEFAQPLNFTPGTSNVYSNFGYQLLGRVIEKASGKRYIDYIQQDLLGLANITNIIGYTNVIQSRSRASDLAPWELWYESPYVNDPSWGPSAVDYPTNMLAQSGAGGNGYYFEAFDSFGGISASAVGLCAYMQNYWVAGDQRVPNEYYGWGYTFFGGLAGSSTVIYQNVTENPSSTNGLEFAAIFNGGASEGANAPSNDAYTGLLNASTNITSWPTNGGGMVQWNTVSTNINKNAASVTVQLVRSGLSTLPVKVSYTTYSLTAGTTNYVPSAGVVSFAANQTSIPITINLLNDGVIDPPKQFSLELISASGGAWLGKNYTSVVNIIDTNTAPSFINGASSQVNGVFRTQIKSSAGMIISVQVSTNLMNWQTLQTFTNVSGTLTVTETNVTNWRNAFYRAVVP